MDENRKHSQKKLLNGCTTLMYACQNGLTSKVINEIRNKVCVNIITSFNYAEQKFFKLNMLGVIFKLTENNR